MGTKGITGGYSRDNSAVKNDTVKYTLSGFPNICTYIQHKVSVAEPQNIEITNHPSLDRFIKRILRFENSTASLSQFGLGSFLREGKISKCRNLYFGDSGIRKGRYKLEEVGWG